MLLDAATGLASGALQPIAWGLAYLAVYAVSVLVMAQLQWMGLRHPRCAQLIGA